LRVVASWARSRFFWIAMSPRKPRAGPAISATTAASRTTAMATASTRCGREGDAVTPGRLPAVWGVNANRSAAEGLRRTHLDERERRLPVILGHAGVGVMGHLEVHAL